NAQNDDEAEYKAAGEELALAKKADPSWDGLLFWQAVLAAKRKDRSTAIALLHQYVAKEPDDVRGYAALVGVESANALGDEGSGLEPTAAAALAPFEGYAEALARLAQTTEDLNRAAEFYGRIGKVDKGFELLERAVVQNRGCMFCGETRALLLYDV